MDDIDTLLDSLEAEETRKASEAKNSSKRPSSAPKTEQQASDGSPVSAIPIIDLDAFASSGAHFTFLN